MTDTGMVSPTDGETACMSNNLYDTDFHAWANEQAALLRAGKLDAADIAHIAEEIENLGRGEQRELVSRLNVLLLRLLRWQQQAMLRGHTWQINIGDARAQLRNHLADNPSLADRLPEATAAAYRYARRGAAAQTELPDDAFPAECPWSFAQIMDGAFWPD